MYATGVGMIKKSTEIQKRSDAKRGVKTWGTKLPLTFIKRLKALSAEIGKPQSKIIIEAVEEYERNHGKNTPE